MCLRICWKQRWGPFRIEVHVRRASGKMPLRKTQVRRAFSKVPSKSQAGWTSFWADKDKRWWERCTKDRSRGQRVNYQPLSSDNSRCELFCRLRLTIVLTLSILAATIGGPKHRYLTLERSTYYVSPKNSIPGGRIDDRPYSNIFIGWPTSWNQNALCGLLR